MFPKSSQKVSDMFLFGSKFSSNKKLAVRHANTDEKDNFRLQKRKNS